MWGSLSVLCCLVASEARAGRRRLSEFPVCGVKLHLQYPSHSYFSGRGLEDVYCATSPTLEFVPDENGVPVYIGVGCCDNAGVCHRYAGPSYNDGCFAGWYDEAANVLGDPKTWDQAVDVCHNEGMELCAAPLSDGICLSTGGCMYNRLYQWSTTECEPGDANYQEGCETPTAAPATTGYVMDDSSIRTAVAAWIDDRTAAEASYGHISAWDTSRVRDMGHLFSEYWGWSEFNEDISAWDTSSVTTFTYMFYYASSFNQPISGWSVDKATSMTDMFRKALAFDQDLGWCLGDHVNFASAFEKTKCQSTQCGVSQKDVIGNCERFARPCLIGTKRQCHINSPTLAFLLANILLALLASAEWYVHRRKEEDETYVAAARRLLCCRRCQSKMESSSVTSPRPDSPAGSPSEDSDEEATTPGSAETVELPNFSKWLTSFLFREQDEAPTEEAPKEGEEAAVLPVAEAEEAPTEQPPRPPRARRWFSRTEPEPAATPHAEEETATLPVFAEAEEATEQPPPPPPARRWFSSAEPEPAAPKAEATYSRMKDWYNAPEAAALSATWGAFPAPDEFQTWPGFVAVTNAFLDREAG